VFGARPVKRALQREVQTLLAQALLRGEFTEGDHILVEASADGSCLELHRASPEPAAQQQQQRLPPAAPANGVADGRPTAARKAAPAAATNGVANGTSTSSSAPSPDGMPPSGKKKVVRLVRKKQPGSSSDAGAANGLSRSSSSGSKAAANGATMSRSSSSNGIQSMPLSFDESE
jgi:ATP-dependent Clp protease ATP-binding subunit ClpB